MTKPTAGDHSLTQASRLKKLISANQMLAQDESLDELLPGLLRLAQEVTFAEGASIMLYQPESDTLEFSMAINDAEGIVENLLNKKIQLQMGEGIAGSVAKNRESLLIKDVRSDKRFSSRADDASGFITKSILCVPVVYQNDLLGVVQVLNSKVRDSFDKEDQELLESFANQAAVALIRAKLLETALQQERMQAQLDAAARIQSHFLPKMPSLEHSSHVWAVTKPAISVGGDFYDCIPMPDGSVTVCVADVSGKGLPAALVAATIWTNIRSLSARNLMPGELLEELNKDMYDVLAQELFATMVVARYMPEEGRTVIGLAGHLPPIYIHQGGVDFIEGISGPPIGVDLYSKFVEKEIVIEPEQSLVFITDGVSEARNNKRLFFGDERIKDFLVGHTKPPVGPGLVEQVEKWLGPLDANDDITVMELWKEA